LFPRPEQTIAGIGRLLRQGELSCVDILDACLEQVDEWEPKVRAWVVLDRDGAMEQARVLEEELRSGRDRGPLHGVPVGVKDIIDVKGFPTACGARRWADRIAYSDADVVDQLRNAGAVVMGKTVTTPYAWIDPPLTRNPWNLDRTPGGSSSGSAAAVACGMCYGAIGSQTGGSITRPASFCGVCGLKPCHWAGAYPKGVLPLAPSLDHIGPLARTIRDIRLLYRPCALCLREDDDAAAPVTPPSIVRFRGFFDRRSSPSMSSAFQASLDELAQQGAEILELDDPIDFEEVLRHHRTVMSAEAASVHSDWLDAYPDDYPPRITELIREGRSRWATDYVRAMQQRGPVVTPLLDLFQHGKFGAIVTPAAIGTAPEPSTTGDPAFNSPWSFAGLSTVTFPIGVVEDGMPVGLQLISFLWSKELELLQTAEWCERAIRSSRQ
jgi:aspartyl-tRNA(Asn)/glutamyl-tRNA(Gln) amidotransferase subunit A